MDVLLFLLSLRSREGLEDRWKSPEEDYWRPLNSTELETLHAAYRQGISDLLFGESVDFRGCGR